MIDNEQFAKAFRIETARARDFQSIASVAFLIAKAPSQIMPTVASLDRWLNTDTAVDDTIKEDVLESLTKFISLVLNPKLSEPIKRGRLSPAEFIMICYFMSLIRKRCADEEISRAVGDLRDDVRQKHDDIRTNNKVFKTMFTFINNFLSSLVGKATTGQRAKRKREGTGDTGAGRKPAPEAGTPQAARRTKVEPLSTPSSRRPLPTRITTPAITPIPNTPSRGSVIPQRSILPQQSVASGPSPVNTASNRPTYFDPLAVVEAAKLQAGQYSRSGGPSFLEFFSISLIYLWISQTLCPHQSIHSLPSAQHRTCQSPNLRPHLQTIHLINHLHHPIAPIQPTLPLPLILITLVNIYFIQGTRVPESFSSLLSSHPP